jgi:hypothetical protein
VTMGRKWTKCPEIVTENDGKSTENNGVMSDFVGGGERKVMGSDIDGKSTENDGVKSDFVGGGEGKVMGSKINGMKKDQKESEN